MTGTSWRVPSTRRRRTGGAVLRAELVDDRLQSGQHGCALSGREESAIVCVVEQWCRLGGDTAPRAVSTEPALSARANPSVSASHSLNMWKPGPQDQSQGEVSATDHLAPPGGSSAGSSRTPGPGQEQGAYLRREMGLPQHSLLGLLEHRGAPGPGVQPDRGTPEPQRRRRDGLVRRAARLDQRPGSKYGRSVTFSCPATINASSSPGMPLGSRNRPVRRGQCCGPCAVRGCLMLGLVEPVRDA